jgi:hypothetical protein
VSCSLNLPTTACARSPAAAAGRSCRRLPSLFSRVAALAHRPPRSPAPAVAAGPRRRARRLPTRPLVASSSPARCPLAVVRSPAGRWRRALLGRPASSSVAVRFLAHLRRKPAVSRAVLSSSLVRCAPRPPRELVGRCALPNLSAPQARRPPRAPQRASPVAKRAHPLTILYRVGCVLLLPNERERPSALLGLGSTQVTLLLHASIHRVSYSYLL